MKSTCIKCVCLWLCVALISCGMAGCGLLSLRKNHSDNHALRAKIVQIAVQYNGAPYRYGGCSPAGFDCSGFASYVFKQAGIELPRTAEDQYHQGKKVAKSDPGKGDLVFFTRWGFIGKWFSPSHVGIYVGNKRFIHAPKSGGNVRYDSLDNPYWQGRLKGVRNFTSGR